MSDLLRRPFLGPERSRRQERGGVVSWRNHLSELDRSDGPALTRTARARKILLSQGELLPRAEYWFCGKRHRSDGPAVLFDIREALIFSAPFYEYWQEGQLHRSDGPARVFSSGAQWYKKGKLHRISGPALNFFNIKKWYAEGLLSRKDGPAVIRNAYLAKKEKRPLFEWHLNGQLHRLDGPAVIYPKGHVLPLEEYWQEGELRREDGPEIVWPDGQGWKRGSSGWGISS